MTWNKKRFHNYSRNFFFFKHKKILSSFRKNQLFKKGSINIDFTRSGLTSLRMFLIWPLLDPNMTKLIFFYPECKITNPTYNKLISVIKNNIHYNIPLFKQYKNTNLPFTEEKSFLFLKKPLSERLSSFEDNFNYNHEYLLTLLSKKYILKRRFSTEALITRLDFNQLSNNTTFFGEKDFYSNYNSMINTKKSTGFTIQHNIDLLASFINKLFLVKKPILHIHGPLYKNFNLKYIKQFGWTSIPLSKKLNLTTSKSKSHIIRLYTNKFLQTNYLNNLIFRFGSLKLKHLKFFTLSKSRFLKKLISLKSKFRATRPLIPVRRTSYRLKRRLKYYRHKLLYFNKGRRRKTRNQQRISILMTYNAYQSNDCYKFTSNKSYTNTTYSLNKPNIFTKIQTTGRYFNISNPLVGLDSLYTYTYFLFNPLLMKFSNNNPLVNLDGMTSKNIYLRKHLYMVNTNLLPSISFDKVIGKKIGAHYLSDKFSWNVTPLYYSTLIRFLENVSGNRSLIQVYPFLNQQLDNSWKTRYLSWIARMKSYERMLGRRFFMEESLHIMHLSFTLRDSRLFSSWLKTMILRISFWKTRSIFRFLKYLMLSHYLHVFDDLKIKGLKIKLKGKISVAGNSRKRTILYRVGKTSHSEIQLRVDHTKETINTFTGVMGFQVWIFY